MPTTSLLGCDATSPNYGDDMNVHRASGVSSRHFLKLVEDQGRVGFWSIELGTGHINGSVGLFRLLGLPPFSTLAFAGLVKMIHPGDRGVNADMMALIRSGQAIEREFRIIRHDNTLRWIQTKAEVLVDAEGVPTRAVGLMIDVTEQHEARMILEEAWLSYQRLVSGIAAVKWRALPDGTILSLLRWEELTGQTLAETENWGWLDAIHPDERDIFRSLWAESGLTRQPYSFDIRIRCVDGIYRRYMGRGAPLCAADGTVREWIGFLIETAASNDNQSGVPIGDVDVLDVAHIRAARALLDWSMEDLSVKAGISVSTIRRLERGIGNRTKVPHMKVIRQALEQGGVRFGRGANAEITVSLPV